MYIHRNKEEEIIYYLNYFPAIALLGPRQVGKTTLVKEIKSKLSKESIYLDLENPIDAGALRHPVEFLDSTKDKIVIIDEIQRFPELFPILRSSIDTDRENGRFILLGSASKEILHQSNETLAGRIVYIELTPLTIIEVNQITDFRHHWLKGGFPIPFTIANDNVRIEWLRSFISNYIERDLRNLGLSSSANDIQRLLYMLASVHGGLLNYSSLANSIGVGSPIVKNIISFFERSFIIRYLQPWYTNIGKRLVKSPKIYFRDSGIVNYLHSINNYQDLLKHPMLGNLWEGYVIESLINILGSNYQYYFYRTADGTECDLVIFNGVKCIAAVETKFSTNISRTKSMTITAQDLSPNKSFFIIPVCPKPYYISEKILVASLEQVIEELKVDF